MQNIIKGFWLNFGCSTGKTVPAVTIPSRPQPKVQRLDTEKVRGERKLKNGGNLDMDKAFEVAYRSVSRATNEFMDNIHTLNAREKPALKLDKFHRWNKQIEMMLIEGISEHYPNHRFISRNKHQNLLKVAMTDEPTWLLDPLHGAKNLLHGFPYACIKLAFWMYDQPRFSIIWNPLLDQCFTARLGHGVHMNVQRLHVSKCTELSDALVMHELLTSCSFGSSEEQTTNSMGYVNQLASSVHGLRSLGCAASDMCIVAQGMADAYLDFNCSGWDLSTTILLVKEAGGVVLDPSLEPFDLMSRRILCASTQQLAEQISAVISSKGQNKTKNQNHNSAKKSTDSEETHKRHSHKEYRSDRSDLSMPEKSLAKPQKLLSKSEKSLPNAEKPWPKTEKPSSNRSDPGDRVRRDRLARRIFQTYTKDLFKDESVLPMTAKDPASESYRRQQQAHVAVDDIFQNTAYPTKSAPQHVGVPEKNGLMVRSVLCSTKENLPIVTTESESTPQPVHLEIKAESSENFKPPKDDTLQKMGFNDEEEEDFETDQIIHRSENTHRKSRRTDKSVKTDEMVLKVSQNSALPSICPHFQTSTKFSGIPKKFGLNSGTRQTASNHPTDPTLPGQGSMF